MEGAQQGGEGERGIGATVLGGGAGAFLGHELGHSKMATLGGIAVGAIAANAFEHHHKKKKEEKRMEHAYDNGYVHGESRGIDDDDDDDDYERDDRFYASRKSLDRDDRYDDRSHLSRRSIDGDDRYDDRSYVDSRSFEEERDYDYEPPRPHHHHHHHRDDYDDDYYSRRDSRY